MRGGDIVKEIGLPADEAGEQGLKLLTVSVPRLHVDCYNKLKIFLLGSVVFILAPLLYRQISASSDLFAEL